MIKYLRLTLALVMGLFFVHPLPTANAAALMKLEGKLVSFTEEHYLIEREDAVYYIHRKALKDSGTTLLEKPGETVSVKIPPSAIALVKSLKKPQPQKKSPSK